MFLYLFLSLKLNGAIVFQGITYALPAPLEPPITLPDNSTKDVVYGLAVSLKVMPVDQLTVIHISL
jgi:hypothetical protein